LPAARAAAELKINPSPFLEELMTIRGITKKLAESILLALQGPR
jgi:hypothetical protein